MFSILSLTIISLLQGRVDTMAERIEQGITPETYRGDNHSVLNDRSFIEATINCDRLEVSFRLLAKHNF